VRTLRHIGLSSHCRIVRLLLAEKQLEFELMVEPVWERRREFLVLNPAGEVPVLTESDGLVLCGLYPIVEHIEESYPELPLLGQSKPERAEIRRLVDWFARKFEREVTSPLVGEKLLKRFLERQPPDTGAIRAGLANIGYHLDYIAWLSERRRWLAGDKFSLADIAAAAELSAIDYIGDVPWDGHQGAKDWYVRVKSRPSFRPILADHIPGVPPPKHYANLDF
jgi:glutathione S-transferase